MALTDGAEGCLPHDGERLDQETVQLRSIVEPLTELARLGLKFAVRELLDLGFERVYVGDQALKSLDLAAFADPEELVEYTQEVGKCRTSATQRWSGPNLGLIGLVDQTNLTIIAAVNHCGA